MKVKHQTFERFEGMWLGGVIGQAVVNQKFKEKSNGAINFPSQTWILERKQIARILLQRVGVVGDNLQLQPETATTKAQHSLEQDQSSTVNSQFVPDYSIDSHPLELIKKNLHPLLLLSLIFLEEDHQHLLSNLSPIISGAGDDLKSANIPSQSSIDPDLLVWNYLIQLILSNEPSQLDFALAVEQTRKQLQIRESLLINKLLLVAQNAKNGVGLQQTLEELSTDDNLRQQAIALSWYCVITTPQDFKLSILRAASIDSPIAELTTTLTGTLSGAYNGIAGIPGNWRTIIIQAPNYDSENLALRELFQTWLGIYSINHNQESYNQKIDAVAASSMIQPRKTLNIISQ
ncbi:MAG: hypothetical protein AAGF83_11085 [Cyanobacteria bacterium P01_G01_bin.67]